MSNLTDNVTLLNIAKATADTGDVFIPANTIFTIDPSGAGDFETILEACNFLQSKYSNGPIIFQLSDGTHTIKMSDNIVFNGNKFNIPIVKLSGSSVNNCTVQIIDDLSNDCYCIRVMHCNLQVSSINFAMQRVNNLSHMFLINGENITYATSISNLHINNCNFNNVTRIAWIDALGTCIFSGTINIVDSNENTIIAQSGECYINNATINVTNHPIGGVFWVNCGGFIKFQQAKLNGSNVRTWYNRTFNSWDTNGYGYIGGTTV